MTESGRPALLGINADLWDLLACPCPEHAPVAADESAQRVVCTRCRTSFEVRDGIPVMLLDEAVPGPNGVGTPAEA
ncbi:MAG: Trm112 family protein [Actinobacteria bacterium]|nr:Trm112 family protein [Actinomycetota bacterium]